MNHLTLLEHEPEPGVAFCAGLLYLAVIVCGIFAEGYARDGLVGAPRDETAKRLRASLGLYWCGVAADLIMCTCDGVLAVLLAKLLAPCDSLFAAVGAALRLLQTAILGSGAVLSLVAAAAVLETHDELVAVLLDLHENAYQIALVFFGVSCAANGVVMMRPTAPTPRILGFLFFVAGVGYVVDSAGLLLLPDSLYDGSASPVLMAPALIAEFGFCNWLLFYGGRRAC